MIPLAIMITTLEVMYRNSTNGYGLLLLKKALRCEWEIIVEFQIKIQSIMA